jgi:hypothetical protein
MTITRTHHPRRHLLVISSGVSRMRNAVEKSLTVIRPPNLARYIRPTWIRAIDEMIITRTRHPRRHLLVISSGVSRMRNAVEKSLTVIRPPKPGRLDPADRDSCDRPDDNNANKSPSASPPCHFERSFAHAKRSREISYCHSSARRCLTHTLETRHAQS